MAGWNDTSRSTGERAAALLAEMTIEEKASQLGSVWARPPRQDEVGGEVAPMESVFSTSGLDQVAAGGLGHLTRIFGTEPVEVAEGVARLRAAQRRVVELNRFSIPAIAHEECLTGFTAFRATVYPAAIAWGATFDPELIGEMAQAIGEDMRAVGVHQGLSPLLDVVRDYRWGRVEETIGEDRYVVRRGPSTRRYRSHAQALRRVLRLARRPEPRAGVDGSARARGRHAAQLRDGGTARRCRVGHELLLGYRQRPGGCVVRAAHARPAQTLGLHGDRGQRLRSHRVPPPHASRRG